VTSLDFNAVRAVAIGVILVALFVFFFVFPGHDPEPNHVPIAVTGPGAAQVTAALDRGDAFDVRELSDPAAARQAILDREVYGALVTGPSPRILVASAASPQVATIIEEAGRGASRAAQPAVEDVKPLDGDDPRGLAINLTTLPLSVTAILGTLLLANLAPRLRVAPRLAALAVFAVLGGLVTMLIVSLAIGALPGPYLALSGLAALAIAAIAIASSPLIRALGDAGVGLSFVIFLMLANPASGAASAPELLPDPWREGGAFLPSGAAATGTRNIAYFDGADLLMPLLVLLAYVLLGAAALAALDRRLQNAG
jgi:hypothetical protein